MEGCVFCKIAAGEISSAKEYEDEAVIAFRDINPTAPVHVLIVPKKHIGSLADADSGDGAVLGKMLTVAKNLVEKLGVSGGYQVVLNGGSFQDVPHIHFHLKGGVT